MSADNGIYIAKFKKGDGYEFRVAYCFAIDSCEAGDEMADVYRVLYFGNAPVFSNQNEATGYANLKAAEHDYLEYGVSSIDFNAPFPSITLPEAIVIQDKYWSKFRKAVAV